MRWFSACVWHLSASRATLDVHFAGTVGLHEYRSCQRNTVCITEPDTQRTSCDKYANDIAWRQICFTNTHHTHHITQTCTYTSKHTHTDTRIYTHSWLHEYCCHAQMSRCPHMSTLKDAHMHNSSCVVLVFVYADKAGVHGEWESLKKIIGTRRDCVFWGWFMLCSPLKIVLCWNKLKWQW